MGKLVFWLIILLAMWVLGRRISTYLFNNAQAQHSTPVLVVTKQTREFMGQTRQQHTELPPPNISYYVTFRPLAGENPKEFKVSKAIYQQLAPEQTGVLVFKGHRFIAFEPSDTD